MIRIKVCDSSPKSACAYYRSIGPFSKLYKINKDVDVQYLSSIGWQTMADADIILFPRPFGSNIIAGMHLAKDFGIKIWIDYDDCIHEIPKYNPVYEDFQQEVIKKNIDESFKLADIVSVSTDMLKQYYADKHDNIVVIENAFNNYNFAFNKVDNQVNFINWRGSQTHRNDIRSCADDIFSIAREYENIWGWSFIGNELWYMTEHITKVFNLKEQDIIDYHKYIKNLKPSIQIFPLLDNIFNRSKSNCSWLEATYSGAAMLAPDFPEFNKPGIFNYSEKEKNFKYNLEKLIKSRELRKENYLKSFEYIHDNLLLSKINEKRIQIIEGIL
jgi:hypothetical protein